MSDPALTLDPLEAACLRILADQGGLDAGGDPAHDTAHLMRVLATARQIARAEGPHDPQVLTAAALLHDLVNLPKDHPERAQASRRSAEAAGLALAGIGLAQDKIAATCHAIAAHSFSAGIAPQTPEARAVQDADRLDALGAIGIARMFAVAGQLGRSLYDAADPLAQARALDDRRFALDHFETKLFALPQAMQTATGRALASERAEWMQGFRQRLLTEVLQSPQTAESQGSP